MWEITLRNPSKGIEHKWKGKYLYAVVRQLNRYLRRRLHKDWGRRADQYIRDNYRRRDMSEMIIYLSHLLHRPITRNMIIGKYHRLKNGPPSAWLPTRQLLRDPRGRMLPRDSCLTNEQANPDFRI